MKILITGATGFIGRRLTKQLIDEGHYVFINIHSETMSQIDSRVFSYRLNETNIDADTEFLKREGFDGIIHLASLYLTVHKPSDVLQLIDSNVRFGSYLLECAANAKIPWFINTGTFWQNYENAQYSPVNLYAATKQAFESIAKYYIETDRIKFCTLRLCDSYGPDDTRPKIFNLWNRIALSGETFDMSPGNQLVDTVYIDDIVNAFKKLTMHMQKKNFQMLNGSVYAVKADKRYTLKELAGIFENVTDKKLNINWGTKPYREREIMIPWEDGITVPGWKPEITIQTGIKRTFVF